MKYFLHLLENLVLAEEKIMWVDTNYSVDFGENIWEKQLEL